MNRPFNFRSALLSQITVTTALLILVSCQENSTELLLEAKEESNKMVTLLEATQVANTFLLKEDRDQSTAGGREKNPEPRRVMKSDVVSEKGTVVFYLFNYEGGGFMVLSATKRYYPVLARSDKGSFDMKTVSGPLEGWVNHTRIKLKSLIDSDGRLEDEGDIAHRWKTLGVTTTSDDTKGARVMICNDPNYTYPVWINPMLTTAWGQGCGYNDLSPVLGDGCGCDQRAFTGCVATAMAQIMRHWSHPAGYNWGGMVNNAGSNATAILMRDAGMATNMNYGCNESVTSYQAAETALRNNFQYGAAQFIAPGSYTRSILVNELNNGRPTLLAGFQNNNPVGHAWVCDGYFIERLCDRFDDYYLNMNWGFDANGNGYYHDSNWNGFNLGRQAIINIHP